MPCQCKCREVSSLVLQCVRVCGCFRAPDDITSGKHFNVCCQKFSCASAVVKHRGYGYQAIAIGPSECLSTLHASGGTDRHAVFGRHGVHKLFLESSVFLSLPTDA